MRASAPASPPQVVVNGRLRSAKAWGIDGPSARRCAGIRRDISWAVAIAGRRTPRVSGWCARPQCRQVSIRRGENGGKTLPIKNVVRELTRLGDWNGGAKRYAVPAGPAGLKTAILVQASSGGPILAAAKG